MGLAKGGKFLLTADLQPPEERVGRRKRARLKAEQREAQELNAEKRPRTQGKWLEEERKKTRLPTASGGRTGRGREAEVADEAVSKSAELGGDGTVGRKKAKRLAVLEKKKAQKASKKAVADRKAHAEAAQALRGKAVKGQLSNAASDLLQRCRRDAVGEQRLLAMVAERLASDPEKELDFFDIFFELHANGCDARTKQLALLSAVAVFKDLVPGYRIREPTEQEKSGPRSKGVLQMERSEMALLQAYRRLLPVLEAAMKRQPGVFAAALAALVKAAADFNYRQRLIQTAVKYANSAAEGVRRTVSEGLQDMVEADRRLEASKEVVLAIGHVAQAAAAGRGAGLKTDLLLVLLRLQIGRAEDASLHEDGGLADADDEVRRGLAEASINQGAEHLRKAEAELLYEVFVVYLRTLRQRHVHGRELIAAALVGLARWGQQVNLELLLEILGELRHTVLEAITQADELVALQGLNCALVLLSGPSQALLTDATWLADAFTRALALALPSLHSAHSESTEWPPPRCYALVEDRSVQASSREVAAAMEAHSLPALVLRCLDNAMRCPHGFGRASDSALAGLLENLFLLAASADPYVGFALLREAATLLKKHYRLHTLLDTEGGLFGLGGVTDRAVSVAWQLQPLAFSVVPVLAKVGRSLAATIKGRRALLSEIFPARDAKAWLAAEFPQHLASLAEAPARRGPGAPSGDAGPPRPRVAGPRAAAAFCSEADLRTMLGADSAGASAATGAGVGAGINAAA